MSTNSIHLLQNSRSLAKTRTLNAGISKLNEKGKTLKFLLFSRYFAFVLNKTLQLSYYPQKCGVYIFCDRFSKRFKTVQSSPKNVKSSVY